MIKRATLRACLEALAVAGLALAAPSVAGANPACGSTVIHSVTLNANMNCPASSGILVGKSGITINLNTHTITGPGGMTSYYGVFDSGFGHVTIENGTVQNFYDDVHVDSSSGTTILKIKAHGANNAGISYTTSQDGVVDQTGASHNAIGISLGVNRNVNVTSSTAAHNAIEGVYDNDSVATLNHVTASNNPGYGVYIDQPVASTTAGDYKIENSRANSNGGTGFEIFNNLPQWQYQANLIGNTANDNTAFGFYAEYWTHGSHNLATGNGSGNCHRVQGCS
jgi:Periplasmic copper-binding protein (NosD)